MPGNDDTVDASGEELMSTSEVAAALDVSPSTVRRYLKEKILPEPGWTRKGRRKERGYSQEWLVEAKRTLQLDATS